ncbi:MAG: hypothetical protein ACR2J9_05310, partial [Gaiellales bacterium]
MLAVATASVLAVALPAQAAPQFTGGAVGIATGSVSVPTSEVAAAMLPDGSAIVAVSVRGDGAGGAFGLRAPALPVDGNTGPVFVAKRDRGGAYAWQVPISRGPGRIVDVYDVTTLSDGSA